MTRPLPIRVTLLLLVIEALLPLGIAGLALVLSGDVVSNRRSFGLVAYAALVAAWPFLTAMGIVSYRRWALFSILGLGTVQTLFAAFCLSSDLRAPSGSTSQGQTPLELAYLSLLAIGMWWLLYFSRRSTRALFSPKS